VTTNVYDTLNEQQLLRSRVAASQMKVMMKSAQSMHKAASEEDASFRELDEKRDECQKVLKAAYKVAYDATPKDFKDQYNNGSQVMVIDDEDVVTASVNEWADKAI